MPHRNRRIQHCAPAGSNVDGEKRGHACTPKRIPRRKGLSPAPVEDHVSVPIVRRQQEASARALDRHSIELPHDRRPDAPPRRLVLVVAVVRPIVIGEARRTVVTLAVAVVRPIDVSDVRRPVATLAAAAARRIASSYARRPAAEPDVHSRAPAALSNRGQRPTSVALGAVAEEVVELPMVNLQKGRNIVRRIGGSVRRSDVVENVCKRGGNGDARRRGGDGDVRRRRSDKKVSQGHCYGSVHRCNCARKAHWCDGGGSVRRHDGD
jgi:hypothetical protein